MFLQWYRDQGKGQEASNNLNAEESFDGTWPIARLYITDYKDQEPIWWYLIKVFDVNATYYF